MAVKGQAPVFQDTDLVGFLQVDTLIHNQIIPHVDRYLSTNLQVSCNLIKFQYLSILWELGDEKSLKILSEEEKAVKLPFNDKR